MRFDVVLICVFVAVSFRVVGCGGDSGASPVCEAGEVQGCPCGWALPDGTQTCLFDGSGWDVCECGSVEGDTGTGTGSDTGTGTGSDTGTGTGSDTDADWDTDLSCAEYPFGDVSYIHELVLGTSHLENVCCFDFTGDNEVDNGFGDMVDALSGILDMNPNAILEDQIQSGELCRLFEYHGMTSPVDDSGLRVPWLGCVDDDADFSDNRSGGERFLVTESSFVEVGGDCTSQPLTVFEPASVSSGHLEATADVVEGMSMPFLIEGVDFVFPLRQARLEADLTKDAQGVSAVSGMLGGAIPHEAIWAYVNDHVAEECSCLNLDRPLIEWAIGIDSIDLDCADISMSQCSEGVDPDFCLSFPPYCDMMSVVFETSFDIDLDEDTVNDAMSVGLLFESISADVSGLTAQ